MERRTPPTIFSPPRRLAARERMLRTRHAPRYLLADMVEDIIERLAFLRHEPARALIVGEATGTLARYLRDAGCEVTGAEPALGFIEEQPYPASGYDLAVSLGTLDTVNDLPGALIHLRNALSPGSLMIASFCGAGSLPALREIMLAADGERPAPRIHPLVDVRAGGELLQRTGFADPVIDMRPLRVSFRSLEDLIADLRAQGLSNVLADPGPTIGKAGLRRAREAFAARADERGRVTETFEILTLSGWRK